MGLALIPLYIHYLGIESYGLIGVYATVQIWMTLFDLGMAPTLQREMARFTAGAQTADGIARIFRSLESIYFGLGLSISLSLFFAADTLAAHWLRVERLSPSTVAAAVAIMAWALAPRWISGLYRSAAMGLQRQVWLNVVGSIFATARGVGVVFVLAWFAPTMGAFFCYQGAVAALEMGVLGLTMRAWMPNLRHAPWIDRQALLSVWRFSGGVFLITFFSLAMTQIDRLLLPKLIGLEQFGYYVLAVTVSGGVGLLVGPICSAVYPRIAELAVARNEEQLVHLYHRTAEVATLLAAPLAITIAFFAPELLLAWTRDRSLSGAVAPVLALYVLGSLFNALMIPPGLLQLAFGWTSLGAYTNGVATFLLVPAFLWLVPRHGVMAAVGVWLALNLSYAIVTIPILHSRLLRGQATRWYLRDVLRPIAIVLAVLSLTRWGYDTLQIAGTAETMVIVALAWAIATLLAALATGVVGELRLRLRGPSAE